MTYLALIWTCTMGLLYIFLFIVQAALGADEFCALQEGSVRVSEGESVTIPCEFTFPGYKEKSREAQAEWFETEHGDCNDINYMKKDKYKGRLSYSHSDRNDSITIHNVNKMDGPVICCQITTRPGSFKFYPKHGTHLLFSGQMWVDQLEAVPAQIGGNTIIPCYINYPPGYDTALSRVTWKRGERGETCRVAGDTVTNEKNNMNNRFSLVNFPDDVSLRINNIQEGDGVIYCCSVTFGGKQYRSKHGTELVIQGSRSHIGPNIDQPQEPSAPAGGITTIRCSYSIDNDGEYLGKLVYWRAGSPVGPIAYHPSTWMVNPTYKGRTTITAQADLQIQGGTGTDSDTYYCFVILKSCVGNVNIMTSIKYGPGTRLTVTELVPSSSSQTNPLEASSPVTQINPNSSKEPVPSSSSQTTPPEASTTASSPVSQINPNSSKGEGGRTTIIIITLVVIVVVLVVLCGILIKRKGSCRKKDETSHAQPDPALRIYEEADKMQNKQGQPAMVYAVLNMPALDPGKSKPHQNKETVYSMVKN